MWKVWSHSFYHFSRELPDYDFLACAETRQHLIDFHATRSDIWHLRYPPKHDIHFNHFFCDFLRNGKLAFCQNSSRRIKFGQHTDNICSSWWISLRILSTSWSSFSHASHFFNCQPDCYFGLHTMSVFLYTSKHTSDFTQM
jgi:hypothetical protein